MSALLEVQGVSFSYAHRKVLEEVSFTLGRGELLALLGINGAGKSTLLRLLLGFERPASGSIRLDGRPLAEYSRRALAQWMAYVPQAHRAVFPYRVDEVVGLGTIAQRGWLRGPAAPDRTRCMAALEQLGIADLGERDYSSLSGGERQLVLIARALAQQARILVLDEPASALDYGNQIRLLERLRVLADAGYAIVFTTHHPEQVHIAADHVALLVDGRIAAAGAPRQLLNAPTLRRLYGVKVEMLVCADGTPAFWPRLSGH